MHMSQFSRGIFASLAIALTFGAAQFALGRDLTGGVQDSLAAPPALVNRTAKADRAPAVRSDVPTQTISLQLNGVDGLCITKLDVLDGIGAIRICTEYTAAGTRLDLLPSGAEAVAECKPVYEEVPGWDQSTFGVKRFDDLPQNARAYLRRIEQLVGVPIAMV